MHTKRERMRASNTGAPYLGPVAGDPNLAAWYVAGRGQTDAGGGLCSAWADQSGNARNLVQAVGAAQPAIQSDGSILFNGTDEFLKTAAFTLSQPLTYYFVFNQITWASSGHLLDGDTVDSAILYQSAVTPDLRLFAGAFSTPVTFLLNQRTLAVVQFNGASSLLAQKNTAGTVSDAGAQNPGGLTMGAAANAAAFSNIQAWELIVRTAADSATVRTQYITYLMQKYGISP